MTYYRVVKPVPDNQKYLHLVGKVIGHGIHSAVGLRFDNGEVSNFWQEELEEVDALPKTKTEAWDIVREARKKEADKLAAEAAAAKQAQENEILMANRKCEWCGRIEGLKPHRSYKRNYSVVLAPRHPHKLLCQWCRAKLNRN